MSVEGPRPINTGVTTSGTTEADDLNQEGKIPGGASVKREEGASTPVKDGSSNKATPDKTIEDRTAQPLLNEEITVEAAVNYLESLSESINDNRGDEYVENPAQTPEELQWVTDDEVREAESDVKTAFGPFESLKQGASRLKRALLEFVNKFRASKEVVPEMANAMSKLAEARVEGGATVKEASEAVATLLEESPKALINELKQQGLHDVVADLQASFRVATAKNLAKMKSKLVQPEVLNKMKAVQGMSQEKAELVVNGALILAKLANAGGGKNASSIAGRGYIFGRIPSDKFELVKWVLDMDSDMALDVLAKHPRLANTTFAEDVRSLDRKAGNTVLGPRQFTEGPVTEEGVRPTTREAVAGSVEDIFEDGALPVFERAEAEKQFQDDFNAFLELTKNKVLSERRERAGQHFKETGMAGAISEDIVKAGLEDLKKTKWNPSTSNNDAAKIIALKESMEKKYGFSLDSVAVMAQHHNFRRKYISGDALPEAQAQEIAGVYRDLHKEVRGLMKNLTKDDGEGLMSHNDFEDNSVRMTNAIMVNCGYCVYTEPKSPDAITDTFHGALEQDFDGMTPEQQGEAIFSHKAMMAQRALDFVSVLARKGPNKLADLLAEHPAVYESGF